MTPEMKSAIEKAINEHLTGAVAGHLREFIEKAEETQREHAKLTQQNKHLSDECDKLNRTVRRYQDLEHQREDLTKARADLAERELKLAHATAANAVAVAQAELKGFREVTGLVFRNMAVHNSISRRVGVPVEGNRGSNGYGSSPGFVVPSDETESTTTTQS